MLEVILALGGAILLGNILAHRVKITPAIMLIFVGLAVALLPAMHEVREVGLPPHVILEIFLPIMLFWETRGTSLREVSKNLKLIITSGTTLVIVTAFAIAGALTHFFHLDWGVALIIGAALAPTDATAVATLNGKLPKRSITVLKAESLINDGTTLVVFALAIQIAGGAQLSVPHAGGMLGFSFLCGTAVGLLIGWVANKIRAYIESPMNYTLFMMATPFAAFLLSESIEIGEGMKGSGVVAVVVAAFFMTYYSVDTVKVQNRFYGQPVWAYVTYLMNGAIFVLVGVQMPEVWESMWEQVEHTGVSPLTGLLIIITAWAVSLAVRYVVMRPSMLTDLLQDITNSTVQNEDGTPARRRPTRSERREMRRLWHAIHHDPKVRSAMFRERAVSTMAGLRGGVSLAVALSVPTSVEGREFVIFVVAGVVILSMLVQGLTLPAVIRWAKIPADEAEHREVMDAWKTLNREAYEALDQIAAQRQVSDEVRDNVRQQLDFLRDNVQHIQALRTENPEATTEDVLLDTLKGQENSLRLGLIEYQHGVLKRLRDEGKIDMNILQEIEERLDMEEMRIRGPVELE